MMERAFNSAGVFIMPAMAIVFANNLYNGVPADWCVWTFAFFGVLHSFIYHLLGLLES